MGRLVVGTHLSKRVRLSLWSLALSCLCIAVWFGVPLVARALDPFDLAGQFSAIESRLRLGLTESEVIDALGEQPAFRYERESAPVDYYVSGWARREREISGSVLIFKFGEPICYVWFDLEGRAEDYFVGGS